MRLNHYHIFYRKDSQKPNRKSLRRLMQKKAKREGINLKKYIRYIHNKNGGQSSEEFKKFKQLIQKEYACTSEDDCEFPYPYFAMYLENRGLGYLKEYVPWKKDTSMITLKKVLLRFSGFGFWEPKKIYRKSLLRIDLN